MLVSCMSSREVFSIVADRCIYSIHKFRSRTICVYMYYAYCFHLCSCKSSFTFASRVVFSVAYCFLYMFQMKSNGESDENILYLLTSNIAEALIISPCAAAKSLCLAGTTSMLGLLQGDAPHTDPLQEHKAEPNRKSPDEDEPNQRPPDGRGWHDGSEGHDESEDHINEAVNYV
jgi:hypothetical protein